MNITKTINIVACELQVFVKETQTVETKTVRVIPKRGSIEKPLDDYCKENNVVLIGILCQEKQKVRAKMRVDDFLLHAKIEDIINPWI